MSRSSSDAAARLRIWKYVQALAVSHPTLALTATGISQRLEIDAMLVRRMLDSYVADGYFTMAPVERCENGHLCSNELDEGETSGEGTCLQCGPCTIAKYATYKPTATFVSYAKESVQDPKAQRRRMTLRGMTSRAFRRRLPLLALLT